MSDSVVPKVAKLVGFVVEVSVVNICQACERVILRACIIHVLTLGC